MTQYRKHNYSAGSRNVNLSVCILGFFAQFLLAVTLYLGSPVAQAATAEDANFEIGTKLADMLRASRNVISANQPLINDPDLGDKGFTGDILVSEAENIYQDKVGSPLLSENLTDRDRRLIDAQLQALRRIVDGHQADINRQGVGFKGFIPAVFARLANEEFGTIAGSEARIRVTAPPDLVRNRKARPDPWEQNILETKLLASDWPVGKPYTEMVEFEGRPAFRMLLPEYYRESCLACHGKPQGEFDITGYPKEGGSVGDLGGVISIVIFQ